MHTRSFFTVHEIRLGRYVFDLEFKPLQFSRGRPRTISTKLTLTISPTFSVLKEWFKGIVPKRRFITCLRFIPVMRLKVV